MCGASKCCHSGFYFPCVPTLWSFIEYQISLWPLCGLDSSQASCEVYNQCSLLRSISLKDILKLGGWRGAPSSLSEAQHRVGACPIHTCCHSETKRCGRLTRAGPSLHLITSVILPAPLQGERNPSHSTDPTTHSPGVY